MPTRSVTSSTSRASPQLSKSFHSQYGYKTKQLKKKNKELINKVNALQSLLRTRRTQLDDKDTKISELKKKMAEKISEQEEKMEDLKTSKITQLGEKDTKISELKEKISKLEEQREREKKVTDLEQQILCQNYKKFVSVLILMVTLGFTGHVIIKTIKRVNRLRKSTTKISTKDIIGTPLLNKFKNLLYKRQKK